MLAPLNAAHYSTGAEHISLGSYQLIHILPSPVVRINQTDNAGLSRLHRLLPKWKSLLGNSLWKFDLDFELDKCIMYLSLHGEKRAVTSIAHLCDARDAEEKPFTRTQQENAKWIQTKY